MPVATRKHYITESALGDGNCAFNAFILGLSQESVLVQIEQVLSKKGTIPDHAFADFIREAAQAFSLAEASWDQVKQKMLSLRQSNHYQDRLLLQKKLAPIMRIMAIELISQNKEAYKENIETRLLEAFNHPAADDMFKRHEFINNKFALLQGDPDAITKLRLWWNYPDPDGNAISGLDHFLNDMGSLELKQWAGDLELVPLAEYFHLNLLITMPRFNNQPYCPHWANGSLSMIAKEGEYQLNDIQRNELVQRGVVSENNVDDHLFFYNISEADLERKLSAAPYCDQVLNYLHHQQPHAQAIVPADWSAATKQALYDRNIITKRNRCYVFNSDFSDDTARAEAALRLNEVAGKAEIKALWEKYYQDAPTVVLTNPYGCHWDHLLPTTKQSTAEKSVPAAATLSQFRPEKELLQANKWQQFADTVLAHLPANTNQQFVSLKKYIQKNGMDMPVDLTAADVVVQQQVTGKEIYIGYELAGKTVVVDQATQELLDHEYAKKLQIEFDEEESRKFRR